MQWVSEEYQSDGSSLLCPALICEKNKLRCYLARHQTRAAERKPELKYTSQQSTKSEDESDCNFRGYKENINTTIDKCYYCNNLNDNNVKRFICDRWREQLHKKLKTHQTFTRNLSLFCLRHLLYTQIHTHTIYEYELYMLQSRYWYHKVCFQWSQHSNLIR